MYEIKNQKEELYHYGILGMKWGRKKAISTPMTANQRRVAKTKEAYKNAKKQYSRDYDSALSYTNRHSITQYFGKGKKESDYRWGKVSDSAKAARTARTAYKDAKKANKLDKKEAKRIIKEAKAKYKESSKAYDEAFNDYYYRRGLGITKKGRENNNKKWNEVTRTAIENGKARDAYKKAKTSYKKKYR